jgi:hypothetical protein
MGSMQEELNTSISEEVTSNSAKAINPVATIAEENKENEDFFVFDSSVPAWTDASRKSIAAAMAASNVTPQKRVSSIRESLEPNRLVNISKSPLLKLALISSHSKRLSINKPMPDF